MLRHLGVIILLSLLVFAPHCAMSEPMPTIATAVLGDEEVKLNYKLAIDGSSTAALALHYHFSVGLQDTKLGGEWVRYAVRLGSAAADLTSASYLLNQTNGCNSDAVNLLQRANQRLIRKQEKMLLTNEDNLTSNAIANLLKTARERFIRVE